MNIQNIKKDFPIFTKHSELVYLDSAASSQKPKQVIDAVTNVYETAYANIHRGIYDLSQEATRRYESTRQKVASFINAKDLSEIVFTSSTTEAINLVAYGWAQQHLKQGDIIVLSEMEHHSNIVPWLRLKEKIGIEIIYLPITKEYQLTYQSITEKSFDISRIKLVSLTHASNVLGTINPIKEIVAYFKKQGIQAKYLIDAAQSVPHVPVDVQDLDCDFLSFSSHKMFGPSGVGVLWAKKELLETMEPHLLGGHMIHKVTKEKATWAQAPDKFEGGTRNIEGVIGLGAAIDYLQAIGMQTIEKYEKDLTTYALEKIKQIEDMTLFGPTDAENRLGVFSFAIGAIHSHDVAEILNRDHIAIRSGHHCAQVLMQQLGVFGTARASLSLYNTKEDIDKLMAGIAKVKRTMKIKNYEK